MSVTYFAELDRDGLVLRVIVSSGAYARGFAGRWVETFAEPNARKNYASRGHVYDEGRDAFIAAPPSAEYDLDEATATWKPNASERARLIARYGR